MNDGYEVLQRGIAIHKRLERLVLEERGLDELVRARGGHGRRGRGPPARGDTMAARAFQRELPEAALADIRDEVRRRGLEMGSGGEESAEFAPDHQRSQAVRWCCPCRTAATALRRRAGLVAARDTGGLGDFERLVLQQAVTVAALEPTRQRAMRDTERRLAGDVLAEALGGRLSDDELGLRLRPFGVGEEAAVIVFGTGRRAHAARGRARSLPSPRAPASARSSPRGSGCCARWSTRATTSIRSRSPRARGRRSRLARWKCGRSGVVRGPGDGKQGVQLPRGAPGARGDRARQRARASQAVSRSRRLQLLLSLQDDEALALYCDSARPARRDARVRRRADPPT